MIYVMYEYKNGSIYSHNVRFSGLCDAISYAQKKGFEVKGTLEGSYTPKFQVND